MSFWISIFCAFLGGLLFAEIRLFILKRKVQGIADSMSDRFIKNDAYLTFPGPRDSEKVKIAKMENILLKDLHTQLSSVVGQPSPHSDWDEKNRS